MTDDSKSPVDIISEARGAVASLQDEPLGASPAAGTPRTREEHLRYATGGMKPVTNNPRVLKAQARAAAADVGTGTGASAAGAGAPLVDARAGAGAGAPAAGEAPSSSVFSASASSTSAASASSAPDPAEDVSRETSERPTVRSRSRTTAHVSLAARVALAVVVLLVVAAVGGFSVFRWVAVDDASDFQGTWYIAGTDTAISISEDTIQLNDEVSYRYVLNTDSKTLAFTFSYLQGNGHYRFSLDRQQLAIIDGEYGWWDTLGSDLAWTMGALVAMAQNGAESPAPAPSAADANGASAATGAATSANVASAGVTLLSRTPASALASPDPAPASADPAQLPAPASADPASPDLADLAEDVSRETPPDTSADAE